MSPISSLPTFVLSIFGILAVCLVVFAVRFVVPASLGIRQLRHVRRTLDTMRREGKAGPEGIGRVLDRGPLSQAWQEYRRTLFTAHDGTVRATAPAASFFNRDILADARYGDDFVRHVPGLFTGLGIIGTFIGLIGGLQQMLPDGGTTNVVRMADRLPDLLLSVSEAFWASGAAIGAAMVTTLLEKWLLSRLYSHVDGIAQSMDGAFPGGTVEAYLERTMLAAEMQASALDGMADRLAERIAKSIAQSLHEPLQQIGRVVERASGEQSSRAAQALDTLMESFMQRVEATFGQQMTGMRDALERTGGMMQGVEASMRHLVQELRDAGRGMADDMAVRIEEAMSRVAVANEQSAARLKEFLDRLREAGDDQRRQAEAAMREAVEQMRASMQAASASIGSLVEQMRNAGEHSADRLRQQLAEALQAMEASQRTLGQELAGIAAQIGQGASREVEAMVSAVHTAMEGLLATVQASSQGLGKAEDERMARLAGTIEQLMQRLARDAGDAGQEVARSVERVTGLLDALREQVGQQDEAARRTMERTLARVEELLARMGGTFEQAGTDFADGARLAFEQAAARLAQSDAERSERLSRDMEEAVRRIADGSASAGERVAGSVAAAAGLMDTVRGQLEAHDGRLQSTMDRAATGVEALLRRMGDEMHASGTELAARTREVLEAVAARLARADEERSRSLSDGIAAAVERLVSAAEEAALRSVRAAEQASQRTVEAAEEASRRTIASATAAGEAMTAATQATARQTVELAEETSRRTVAAASASADAVTASARDLSARVQTLLDGARTGMAEAAGRIGIALGQLDGSIGAMDRACTGMAAAGELVAATATRQAETASRLESAGVSISQGADALVQAAREHAVVRESTRRILEKVEQVLAHADRSGTDASAAALQMRQAADGLREAERVSREYLQNLSGTVAGAFDTFRKGMNDNLRDAVRELGQLNEKALGLYMSVIEELEGVTMRLRRA